MRDWFMNFCCLIIYHRCVLISVNYSVNLVDLYKWLMKLIMVQESCETQQVLSSTSQLKLLKLKFMYLVTCNICQTMSNVCIKKGLFLNKILKSIQAKEN